ncbi:peptidase U32 family protein [bacterium]
MELLAPAGSKEAFITAVNAGADAVYIGTKNFNARLKADNVNLYDLEVLIDYARKKGVKVYITFNTLVKHEEINNAVKIIHSINMLRPDGIIVQDLGIARIISLYYPDLKLHASTQMAVHNSLGVETLADMGFKRVVLARELSFSEIKNITKKSPIEQEIFVHGALCFCISGMCLFSSVIGSYSGNRGLCTQPCRRIWKTSNMKGYLFSPRDLELADFINKIKNTGVKSLKIEGRMRSSEYVYKTVKAYKLLLDAKEGEINLALKEAHDILKNDYARKKSICIFEGRDNALFEPYKAQCMGKEIGKVLHLDNDSFSIELNEELFKGDRIRISNPETDNTTVFKVKNINKNNNTYIFNENINGYKKGNPVFKAGSFAWDEKLIKKQINEIYNSYSKKSIKKERFNNAYTSLTARVWRKDNKRILKKEQLWVKIDNPKWIPYLLNNSEKIICSINKGNFITFKNYLEKHDIPMEKLIIELTPFIAQREINDYKEAVSYFTHKRVRKYVINNISQPALLSNDTEKIAGSYLYVWNAYSARLLKDYGINYFTVSWEHDILSIRRLANSGLSAYLLVNIFGYPVITRSRMLSKETNYNEVSSDKKNIKFKIIIDAGMNILIPDKPVMIFNAVDKMKNMGIGNFIIDLSFINPQKMFYTNLIDYFKNRKNYTNSFKFNFKRGVK